MPAQIISPSAPSFASSPRLSHVDTGTGVYQHLTQEDGYWNPSHVHHPNRFMDIANNVVPPPSMQPSSQHAYPDRPVHLRNGQFMVPSSTMPMMHHHAGYHPSLSALTSSQFVRAQAITTLPAPRAHKVWILDCKACGTFLTNRGMKVSGFFSSSSSIIVLLFSPHKILRHESHLSSRLRHVVYDIGETMVTPGYLLRSYLPLSDPRSLHIIPIERCRRELLTVSFHCDN